MILGCVEHQDIFAICCTIFASDIIWPFLNHPSKTMGFLTLTLLGALTLPCISGLAPVTSRRGFFGKAGAGEDRRPGRQAAVVGWQQLQ